jgi:small subunit ribosomal protein S27Ae
MADVKKPAGKPAGGGKKSGLWELYEKKGDEVEMKNKTCPKCGVIMGHHKDRDVCGKCKYTVFETKK